MDGKKLGIGQVVTSALAWTTVAGIVALFLFAGGCHDSGVQADASGLVAPAAEAGSEAMVPTLAEIEAVVDMTPEQARAIKAALGRWEAAADELMAAWKERPQRGQGRGSGHGEPWTGDEPPGGPIGGHPDDQAGRGHPMLDFLEESSDILDAGQFVALAGFLAGRMEAHRTAVPEARSKEWRADGARGQGIGPGPGQNGPFEELIEELGLSEDQQSRIRDALRQMREAIEALRSQYTQGEPNREELREGVRKIREEFGEKLRGILEPEQYERLEELRAERRSEMEERRQAGRQKRTERLVDFLAKVLDLSDSQRQQVSTILADEAEQIRALHEKARENEISRDDIENELKGIWEGAMMAIRGLLKPEQADVFDAVKGLVPGHGRP